MTNDQRIVDSLARTIQGELRRECDGDSARMRQAWWEIRAVIDPKMYATVMR